MPEISEIKHGRDVGCKSPTNQGAKYIYIACPECGKTKWTRLRPTTKTGYSRCRSCCGKAQVNRKILPHGKGSKCPRWKGGQHISRGYITIWVSQDDPYYPMVTRHRYVLEHRLVMAKYLGRCLTSQEHVHHKNGIKSDNRIENLELISPANHILYDKLCAHCKLRKEIRLLKKRIKELQANPSIFLF